MGVFLARRSVQHLVHFIIHSQLPKYFFEKLYKHQITMIVFVNFRYSFLEIPQRITMREVWAEINGTIIGLEDISVENGGKLYIWSYANTEGSPEGTLELPNIAVKAGGKFEPLTTENNIVMKINVTTVTVNGNGYVRTNHLELHAVNVTIDLSGMVELL